MRRSSGPSQCGAGDRREEDFLCVLCASARTQSYRGVSSTKAPLSPSRSTQSEPFGPSSTSRVRLPNPMRATSRAVSVTAASRWPPRQELASERLLSRVLARDKRVRSPWIAAVINGMAGIVQDDGSAGMVVAMHVP